LKVQQQQTFQPIENYGLIGNLGTAALVGIDSSIDFLCFPEFDSPTIFAALLDPERGGSFSIRPQISGVENKQMYAAESNVLITRFLSDSATAEVIDFMPLTASTQKSELVRIVRVIHGRIPFRLTCQPAFDYARSAHEIDQGEDRVIFRPANKQCCAMLLRGTAPLQTCSGGAVSNFTLQKGERAVFIFSDLEEKEQRPIDREGVDRDLEATVGFWREWSGRSGYKGRWRDAVTRSALTLKMLTSRRYGALVAAPTLGIPERIGGTRNWDYRYVWLRDAAFTLCTFLRLGYREEADAFRTWLKNRTDESKHRTRPMQIMYGLAGHSDLREAELDHLCGHRNSKPVRIGNGAFGQLQLDIYGELMDAVYLYSKYAHAFPHDEWIDAKRILAWLGENWNQPDEGIWEVRGGHRHFLHSRLMCWVAFDRAIRLAHRRSLSAPLDEWYWHRDAIVEDIYANFWSERLSAFVQEKNSEALDASVLLMPLMRFISPVDPRWLSTMKAIEGSLAEDAFVYRYRNLETQDGLEGEEGSFTCCSFWLVECLARAHQLEKARSYFDKLLCQSNHLGLFSEQIARDGHQLGNFPQALTHLALISAALCLDRRLSGTPTEPWS
jgi:GH15 family glucan-1,4-alpha-glucosidase